MELDSAQPHDERGPAQTESVRPIVAPNTNRPASPLVVVEIESAGSAPPPIPPKKRQVKPRVQPGRVQPKRSKTLDSPFTTTPRASVSPPIPTPGWLYTIPSVPTPPFVTRRLSPADPPASLPAPPPPPQSQSQSQAQKSKTPPVFPRLNVFTHVAGPQSGPSQSQPPPPQDQPQEGARSPPSATTPPRSTSAPSAAENEKEKSGRKEFGQQLLQRLVEKEDPKKAGQDKPVINRLFAVPTTSTDPSPSTAPTPSSTLLKPSTPFGSASVGAGFGSFGLTKVVAFGVGGFGKSATPVAKLAPTPAAKGFGGFGARTGSGSGFASFGTTATGSSTPASQFGFTSSVFSNQASTSPIKTSNIRGEGDPGYEESRDSDMDIDDDLGVDMSGDPEEDLETRARDKGKPEKLTTSIAPQLQTQAQSQMPTSMRTQTQESSLVPSQPSDTTASAPQHPQVDIAPSNTLSTQPVPPVPAHSAPPATLAPTQSMVTPPSPPASPILIPKANALPPASLFYLDPKPRRRACPPASASDAPSPSETTKLIKQTIRKHVTLDPTTHVPAVVDLPQMLGDLSSMHLVVHHNFLPRAPPLNEDYRRAMESLLKKRRTAPGEPRPVYRGAGDDDLGNTTEGDESGIETDL
jgi:hypothetical protein